MASKEKFYSYEQAAAKASDNALTKAASNKPATGKFYSYEEAANKNALVAAGKKTATNTPTQSSKYTNMIDGVKTNQPEAVATPTTEIATSNENIKKANNLHAKIQLGLNRLNELVNGKKTDTSSEIGKKTSATYTSQRTALNDKYLEAAYDTTDGMATANALAEQKKRTAVAGRSAAMQKFKDQASYYSGKFANKDFDEKAKSGLDTYKGDVDITKGKDPGNKIRYADEHKNDIAALDTHGNISAVKDYKYLSYADEDERSVYNYILGTEGSKAADEFLDYIRPSLMARAGLEQAEGISQDSGVSRYMREATQAFSAGINSGFNNLVQNLTEESRPLSAMEYANMATSAEVAARHEGNEKFNLERLSLDAINTVGAMAPMLAAGAVGGGAAGAIVGGLTARGGTYRQLLDEGYSVEQADTVATVVGVAESLTQYVLGGISAAGGKLTGIAKDKVLENITKSGARALTALGFDIGGEVTEEILQNKIEAIARNAVLYTNDPIKFLDEEDAYTAIVTAISTAVLQAPVEFINAKSSVNVNSDVNSAAKSKIKDGSSFSKVASQILNDETLRSQFVEQYGEIQGTSKTEQAKYIAKTLYDSAMAEMSAQQTEAAQAETPAAETPVEPQAPQMTAEQSYMRGLIMSGEVDEILSAPENRAMFEQMTGQTLSENEAEARQQVMDTSRNTFSGETTLAENAVNSAPQETLGVEGENIPPATENAVEGQNERFNSKADANSQQNTPKTPIYSDENTARQVYDQMPDRNPGQRESGQSKNIRSDNAMAPEIRAEYENNPQKYDIQTNKKTLGKALDIMDEGVDAALAKLNKSLKWFERLRILPGEEMVVLTKILSNELTKIGDVRTARQITADMGAILTETGRFGQANAILRNADPVTVKQSVDQFIDKVNTYLERANGKRYKNKYTAELTAEEIERINNTDFLADEKAYATLINDIKERIGKEAPTSLRRKIQEWFRLGMLSRPATHIGNFAANMPTAGMHVTNDIFSAGMQSLGSKFVELENDEIPYQLENGKWVSVVEGEALTADTEAACKAAAQAVKYGQTRVAFASSEARQVAKDVWQAEKDTIMSGGNKWDNEVSGVIDVQTFKNETMASIRDFIYNAMELEDQPFVRLAFLRSLAGYCDIHQITDVKNVPQKAIEDAMADAYYYTYKNRNALADFVSNLKKIPVVGDLVNIKIPFTTTLANIGMLEVEHQPGVALPLAIGQAIRGESGAKVADTAAKGFTGALTIGLGWLLAANGLLSGDDDDDKNVTKWLKATGHRSNALGGKYDISQLQPWATLLSFGAAMAENYADDEKKNNGFFTNAFNAMIDSAGSIMDMEMVKNISEMLDPDKYGNADAFKTFISSTLEDIPAQTIPGIWQSIVNSLDPVDRFSYTDGDTLDNIIAAIEYYSGVGRKNLPERVNVKGTSSKGNAAVNAVDEVFYPGKIGQGEMNDVDNYIADLMKTSKEKGVVPESFVPGETYTNDNGEEITVGVHEQAPFQRRYSEAYYTVMGDLINNETFKGLSTDAQAAIIKTVKAYAKDIAVAGAFDDKGLEYYSGVIDAVDFLGNEQNISDYYITRQLLLDGNYKFSDKKDTDYALLDKAVEAYNSSNGRVQKQISEDYSNIAKMAEAKKKTGMDAETWATCREIKNNIDEEHEGVSYVRKQEIFNAAIDNSKTLTPAQKKLAKEQFVFTSTLFADTTTYEKVVAAGVSPDDAYNFRGSVDDDNNGSIKQAEAFNHIAEYADNLEMAQELWEILCPTTKKTYQQYAKKNGGLPDKFKGDNALMR